MDDENRRSSVVPASPSLLPASERSWTFLRDTTSRDQESRECSFGSRSREKDPSFLKDSSFNVPSSILFDPFVPEASLVSREIDKKRASHARGGELRERVSVRARREQRIWRRLPPNVRLVDVAKRKVVRRYESRELGFFSSISGNTLTTLGCSDRNERLR